jgi:alpha-tubulin suppressor-like RCC1 family protein
MSHTPTPVPSLKKIEKEVSSISNGTDHSVAVVGGRVMTFGSNKFSQLGRASTTEWDADPGEVEQSSQASSVSCGGWHSVSLHLDGSVKSFGWGGSLFSGAGALGLGIKSASPRAENIDFFQTLVDDKVVQVSCGQQHTLFLTENGSLYGTGSGAYGILGTGDTSDELLPVEITALKETLMDNEKVVKVSCGSSFSAFVTNIGNLYVWGRNDSGQLGLGEESQGDMHSAERYPRRIPFFETERVNIKDVACGENHMVAIASNGAIYYWGDRAWLEPHVVSLPEANGGLKGVRKISAGSKCSFALNENGVLYVWGAKNSGCLVLPDLKKGNLVVPTPIPPSFFGNEKIIDVSANRQRCTVVTTDSEYIVTSQEEAKKIEEKLSQDSKHSRTE